MDPLAEARDPEQSEKLWLHATTAAKMWPNAATELTSNRWAEKNRKSLELEGSESMKMPEGSFHSLLCVDSRNPSAHPASPTGMGGGANTLDIAEP